MMWSFTDIIQWITIAGLAIALGDVRARFAVYEASLYATDVRVINPDAEVKKLVEFIKAHGQTPPDDSCDTP